MSDIMIVPENQEFSVAEVKNQIAKIQSLMKSVMQIDEHYGKIPGVDKNSLYKAGAEKLCLTFRLVAEFEYNLVLLENGHREYQTICKIYTMADHKLVGQGVGVCSTMESKYRYRNQYAEENTGEFVPPEYWDLKKANNMNAAIEKIGGKEYMVKKAPDGWMIFKKGDKTRIENPDLADQYNTVIKMSEKRAYVDATIRATAASDVFTQDVEDMNENDLSGKPGKTENNDTKKPPKQAKPNFIKPDSKIDGEITKDNIFALINKLPDDKMIEFAARVRANLNNPDEFKVIIQEIKSILNPPADQSLNQDADAGFEDFGNPKINEELSVL